MKVKELITQLLDCNMDLDVYVLQESGLDFDLEKYTNIERLPATTLFEADGELTIS